MIQGELFGCLLYQELQGDKTLSLAPHSFKNPTATSTESLVGLSNKTVPVLTTHVIPKSYKFISKSNIYLLVD